MLQFTTWFKSPALQMTAYETLARASCTLLQGPRPEAGLTLLASQHVTHPHAYRHFYPAQAFLEAVSDADLRYSVEVCEAGTGAVLLRHRLPAHLPLHRHRVRDLSLLPLGREDAALLQAVRAAGQQALAPLRLHEGEQGAAEGQPLALAGHFLLGSGEEGVMLPRWLTGTVAQRSASQVFLRTSEVLEMGMCGGPVTLKACGSLVGVVEGLVPLLRPEDAGALTPLQVKSRQLLGGTAVIVEGRDIRGMVAQL